MRSELATKAVDNKEFRGRIRHFMIRRAVVAMDEYRELLLQADTEESLSKTFYKEAEERAQLARRILANPDQFITPLCLVVGGHDGIPPETEDFLAIDDDTLSAVVNAAFDYLQ